MNFTSAVEHNPARIHAAAFISRATGIKHIEACFARIVGERVSFERVEV